MARVIQDEFGMHFFHLGWCLAYTLAFGAFKAFDMRLAFPVMVV